MPLQLWVGLQLPQVSAKAVKALREKSGAGMMDCKKALAETGGDEVCTVIPLPQGKCPSSDKVPSRCMSWQSTT